MSIVEYERLVLLTVGQAAEYPTVSQRFIRRLRYERRILGVKLGGRRIIPASEIDRLTRLAEFQHD